jgi:hypothetical protein
VPVSMSSKGWAKLLRNIEVYYIIATMTWRWDVCCIILVLLVFGCNDCWIRASASCEILELQVRCMYGCIIYVINQSQLLGVYPFTVI